MDQFWPSFFSLLGLLSLAGLVYWGGKGAQKADQRAADDAQEIKELKTDAKNNAAVDGLSADQLDDELRNPPK